MKRETAAFWFGKIYMSGKPQRAKAQVPKLSSKKKPKKPVPKDDDEGMGRMLKAYTNSLTRVDMPSLADSRSQKVYFIIYF